MKTKKKTIIYVNGEFCPKCEGAMLSSYVDGKLYLVCDACGHTKEDDRK